MRLKALAIDVVIGLLGGVIVIARSVSIAALIFAGALAPFVGKGVAIAMLSIAIISLIVSLRSSNTGTIAVLQNSTAPIIALAAASVVANVPANAAPEDVFGAAVVSIALMSLLTGVLLLLLGHFEMGKLFRYLPYPVIGGFIAGAGLLLIAGSINIMVGFPLDGMQHIPELLTGDALLHWLPGIAVGVALFVTRKNQIIAVPLVLISATVVFHLIWQSTSGDIALAADNGWLLPVADGASGWQALSFDWLSAVTPRLIFSNLGSAAMVAFVSVMTLLLETNSVEIQMDRDLSLDRELQANGLANLIASAGGGIVGFSSLSLTTLAHQMGASSRLVGIMPGVMAGMVLVAGAGLLRFVPAFVLGGVLAFLGLTFLHYWLIEIRTTMPREDYIVIVLIAATIGWFGYLTGVGVGLVLAMALFAYKYSQVEVVKRSISGADRHSNVARPRNHLRSLYENGEQICIFQMQGYIFFGTANKLYNQVRARIYDDRMQPLRYMVLDFHLVTGIDTSAALSFLKMQRLANTHDFELVLSNLPAELKGLLTNHEHSAITFEDLDFAMEYCEDRLLNVLSATMIQYSLRDELQKAFQSAEAVDAFLTYLVRQRVQPGRVLIQQDKPMDRLILIATAGVTAKMETDEGVSLRLQKMGQGSVLGEVSFYLNLPATATVVVDRVGEIYYLTHSRLNDLQAEQPELAATFHHFMVKRLAERIGRGNAVLRTVMS